MNARLKSLLLGNSFFVFASSLLVPMYALFAESIGAGVQLAGILFGVKFGANAVADLIVLTIRDKVNLTVAIYRGSMVIRGLCWLYIGLYPSITNLLLVQAITGLAEGFGTPAFSSLLADNLDKGKHIQEWAIWDLIKNPLIALAGIASGFLVHEFGFSALFYAMAAMAIVGSLIPVAKQSSKRKTARKSSLRPRKV